MSVQMGKVVDVSQDAETEESSLRPTGMVIYLGKSVTVPKGSTSTVICLPDGQSSQSKANKEEDAIAGRDPTGNLDGAPLDGEDNVSGVHKCLQ